MKVKSILRKNFMTPGENLLELPERGLVLITGPNGSGKSSWIDSVGSVWNKQVRSPKDRKTHGNLPDKAAKVLVETHDKLRVKRTWSASGKTTLTWEVIGEHKDTSTTNTKGQAALEEEVGDYKPWRWSCLISSQSTDTFSRATSANRRAILEDVLDLDLLARAHKSIHEETSEIKKAILVKTAEITQKEQQVALASQAVSSAQTAVIALMAPEMPGEPLEPTWPAMPKEPQKPVLTLPAQPQPLLKPEMPDVPDEPDIAVFKESLTAKETLRAQLAEQLVVLKQEYKRLVEEFQSVKSNVATLEAEYKSASKQCDLLSQGSCPTCTQTIASYIEQTCEANRDAAKVALDDAISIELQVKACLDENISSGKAKKAEVDAADLSILKEKGEVDSAIRVSLHREQVLASYRKATLSYSQQQAQQLAAYEDQCQQVTEQHQKRLAQFEEHWRATLEQHTEHIALLKRQYNTAVLEWRTHCTRVREQYTKAKTAVYEQLRQTEVTLAAIEQELTDMQRDLFSMSDKYELHTKALAILGPSGVRADILDNAMCGVTQEANAVLSELETDVRVRLFAEGKDVGLETIGGRGPRYEDLSNGEQHRVDFALLRALGRVAAALRGQRDDGTLFIDEAFDGIDECGLDAVCEYVQEISKLRCIVVITHRAEVVSRLRPVKRVEMLDSRK